VDHEINPQTKGACMMQRKGRWKRCKAQEDGRLDILFDEESYNGRAKGTVVQRGLPSIIALHFKV